MYCDEQVCQWVCVSVCPLSYLRNYVSGLYQLFCVDCGVRPFSGGVAVCYVLPVLWMASRFLIMGGNATIGCNLKVTHETAARIFHRDVY